MTEPNDERPADRTRVEWREWGSDAFAEAAREAKPVLLSLSATWCGDCHEMDARTYGDPGIAAHLNDGFVPVRVDVDRHPRVRERYHMGGFPSTVFTTPSGELIAGATYLGPEGFRQVLDRVRQKWDETGSSAGRIPRALAADPTPGDEVTPEIEQLMLGQIDEQYDDQFGGWGGAPKFPLAPAIRFALKRDRDRALRTLDAIRNHLHDDVAGGFFRYAAGRDWSDVAHEKVLDANAALVRAFADAYLYTGDAAYREPAARTVSYLTDDLWSGVAFGGSQAPGEGAAYYAKDASARGDATGPRTDLTAYAGPNALAADALLAYHAYTDDETARTYAVRTLEYLDGELVDDGRVTRYRNGDEAGESGVLTDQARVAGAFARAAQVVSREYLPTARVVAENAIERLHDDGSFRDGPATGPGLLDRPLRPIDANAEMADALLDLAALTGTARYRELARETVGAFAGARDRLGPQVAGYAAVAARLCRPAPTIAVGTDPGSDLHRAALRIGDHETVVVPEAHEADVFAFDVEPGAAYVFGTTPGESSSVPDPVTTPDELTDQVVETLDSSAR